MPGDGPLVLPAGDIYQHRNRVSGHELFSIIIYAQAVFVFFIVPMFGTVILGMMWKRITPAAGFWGLLAAHPYLVSALALGQLDPSALHLVAFSGDAKDMAENLYRAVGRCWQRCRNARCELLYQTQAGSRTGRLGVWADQGPSASGYPFFQRPVTWAAAVLGVLILLNVFFW